MRWVVVPLLLWLGVAVGDAMPLPPVIQRPGLHSQGSASSSDAIPGIKRLSAKPLHADRFQETLCWAVKLQAKGEHHGRALAEQVGVTFLGAVGDFGDVHMMCHTERPLEGGGGNLQQHVGSHQHLILRNSTHFSWIQDQLEIRLDGHLAVQWYNREVVRPRQKRQISFQDPFFPRQWHLRNTKLPGMDINVTGVWARGVTGRGVTVAVVDDGVEWDNPDLMANYNSEGSWDLNDEDPDPMPSANKESNHHGTRCAGEIAAVPNSVCGVGVAWGAKFSGLRVLDGPMTDSLEASAFNKRLQVNDIFSCSWGPDDDGRTVDGPHIMAAKAMKYGVDYGRHGYGSIFVVASGNGGRNHDNCNYDGYANSIYTVTIGAVDEQGRMPFYAEECASMLGVTFSSGTMEDRDIVTTDWTKKDGAGCTDRHTGTSAAAPLAAGMIALMLEARPCLTWRDVQYLIALTAVKVDVDMADWQRNGAGLEHSHKHGFGLLNAWRMVNAAKVWMPVPWMTSFLQMKSGLQQEIPPTPTKALSLQLIVTEADIDGYDLGLLEQVQVTLTLTHPRRGWLDIRLTSPSGTQSVIGAPRYLDNSSAGFTEWSFTTVRCWGESPVGVWNLTILDTGTQPHQAGVVKSWGLHLFGSPMTTEEFQRRRGVIENAMSGEFLNSSFQLPCPPPPITAPANMPVSEKTLKILCLSGAFCVVMAIYETLEYMLCYNEEKKEHLKAMKKAGRAREADERNDNAGTPASQRYVSDASSSETALLLDEEEIPMDTFSASVVENDPGEVTLFEREVTTNRHAGESSPNEENVVRDSHSAIRGNAQTSVKDTQDLQGYPSGSGQSEETKSALPEFDLGHSQNRSVSTSRDHPPAVSPDVPDPRSPKTVPSLPCKNVAGLHSRSSDRLGAGGKSLLDSARGKDGDGDSSCESDDGEGARLLQSTSKRNGRTMAGALGKR